MAEIFLPNSVVARLMKDGHVKDPLDNPVCTRCEKVAHRDIGWSTDKIGQCPHCGHRGKMEVTVREYMKNGLYK